MTSVIQGKYHTNLTPLSAITLITLSSHKVTGSILLKGYESAVGPHLSQTHEPICPFEEFLERLRKTCSGTSALRSISNYEPLLYVFLVLLYLEMGCESSVTLNFKCSYDYAEASMEVLQMKFRSREISKNYKLEFIFINLIQLREKLEVKELIGA